MTPEAYDDEHDHTHDTPEAECTCGRPWDAEEQEGDCLDCGTEWSDEGRRLHFGSEGMLCCWCAEGRASGEAYAV